jgi:predicted nuclease of restriction endonuclease-like (RecB) superfamily
MAKNKKTFATKKSRVLTHDTLVFSDIRSLIDTTRQRVASTINTELTTLYWNVGKRISEEILKHKRGEYGKEIIESLSRHLTAEYGRGWSRTNINRMIQFYDIFQDERICASLRRKLTWTHIKRIIAINDPTKRDFYIEMCIQDGWSVRLLNERIASMLFERTILARKPEAHIRDTLDRVQNSGAMEADMILRSPYLLDFLNLEEGFHEHDFETAILNEMQRFLLELGTGFTFIESQKKMKIDDKVFALDLLFYNRKLKRLVCVDLKVDEFKPSHKGQMELYLNWINQHEKQDGEESPLGIILCLGKNKNEEQVQLLDIDGNGIHVAEYLTDIPSKKELEEQLHTAIQRSRRMFGNN